MRPILLRYDEVHLVGPSITGGKGWNFARLDRYGFPVPRGGVLSAEVYHAIAARPSVSGLVGDLAGVPAAEADRETVRRRLAAVRKAFEQENLPEEAVVQLDDFLTDEGLAAVPLAVRSSASAEDEASSSFAGIHESVLNVTGLEAIRDAIRRCYASLWTPQALAYRRHRQIADADFGCAVLICQMVASPGGISPRAAGVAFSCDPQTGRRDLVAINAAPGLGDALMRGSLSPAAVYRPPFRDALADRATARRLHRPAAGPDRRSGARAGAARRARPLGAG
jgi:pyruvate,water dikinase